MIMSSRPTTLAAACIYSPDSIAGSLQKPISSSLLASEITKRTCPMLVIFKR
jgi:hypothetical protein